MAFNVDNRAAQQDNFKFRLNGVELEKVEEAKFLGIRFDSHLSFKVQIAHVKKTCNDRLNIIKTLSHKHWHLTQETKINIYRSVIGSVLDYSGFVYNSLHKKYKRVLDVIQNNALRIILRKPRKYSTTKLHKEAKIQKLEYRFKFLKEKYHEQADLNGNPLIKSIVEEYKNYIGGHVLKRKTILCNVNHLTK